jgi:pimeloyl-ACP methyl ester carboxylesterase
VTQALAEHLQYSLVAKSLNKQPDFGTSDCGVGYGPKNSPTLARIVNVPMGGSFFSTELLETGEGFPIVLLHGLGDSARTWQWVIEPLASRHRVYALSLPGFGFSANRQGPTILLQQT